MGTCYSHIDFKERVKLFDLAKAGILSIDEIARMLGRHRSTIYREISRNYHNDVYVEFRGWFPSTADMKARRRRRRWEGDLIIFKREHGKRNLTSLVERKTRFQVLLSNADRKSADVMTKIIERLGPLPANGRQTVTFDRGTEFMAWRMLHQNSGMKTYFCDTASPWQKGSVENSNGRVRRYLPLETDLAQLSSTELMAVTDVMNATPRKWLGFQTPKEAFESHLKQLN